jgi:hypothetical protein
MLGAHHPHCARLAHTWHVCRTHTRSCQRCCKCSQRQARQSAGTKRATFACVGGRASRACVCVAGVRPRATLCTLTLCAAMRARASWRAAWCERRPHAAAARACVALAPLTRSPTCWRCTRSSSCGARTRPPRAARSSTGVRVCVCACVRVCVCVCLSAVHITACATHAHTAVPRLGAPAAPPCSAYSNSFVNLAIFKPDVERSRVAAIIGDEAEQLTHLFCVVGRAAGGSKRVRAARCQPVCWPAVLLALRLPPGTPAAFKHKRKRSHTWCCSLTTGAAAAAHPGGAAGQAAPGHGRPAGAARRHDRGTHSVRVRPCACARAHVLRPVLRRDRRACAACIAWRSPAAARAPGAPHTTLCTQDRQAAACGPLPLGAVPAADHGRARGACQVSGARAQSE